MNNSIDSIINSTILNKNKKIRRFEYSQKMLDEKNVYNNDKILNFAQKVNDNIKKELFNIVSETGVLFYSLPLEELTLGESCQTVEDQVRKITQEKLEKRLDRDPQKNE